MRPWPCPRCHRSFRSPLRGSGWRLVVDGPSTAPVPLVLVTKAPAPRRWSPKAPGPRALVSPGSLRVALWLEPGLAGRGEDSDKQGQPETRRDRQRHTGTTRDKQRRAEANGDKQRHAETNSDGRRRTDTRTGKQGQLWTNRGRLVHMSLGRGGGRAGQACHRQRRHFHHRHYKLSASCFKSKGYPTYKHLQHPLDEPSAGLVVDKTRG